MTRAMSAHRVARGPRRGAIRLLISSGPTREPLDSVRFLSNYSTGFMGSCVAREAVRRGHRVAVVSGPAACPPPRKVAVTWVETAEQMRAGLRRHLPGADVLVMAAAVCDFRAAARRRGKLPRRGAMTLRLRATPDIVASLPRRRGQLVVGFALETGRAFSRASRKLKEKRLDLIVGQQLEGSGDPFGRHAVHAFLLRASGQVRRLGRLAKPALARALLDEIEQLWYGQPGRRALRKG